MHPDDFIDATPADILFLALEPITPPTGQAACATYDPQRFASPQRQQAAFDGDPVDPLHDYPAARAICFGCPILAACRRYAEDSQDDVTFLGGQSAEQRLARRRKRGEIAKRRLQAEALTALDAPLLSLLTSLGAIQASSVATCAH
jgi:hypothetical protein